jgi:hypothetical protein
MADNEDQPTKWQPVVAIVKGLRRLECSCVALAIFIALDMVREEPDGHKEFDYGAYCQDCWQKEDEN